MKVLQPLEWRSSWQYVAPGGRGQSYVQFEPQPPAHTQAQRVRTLGALGVEQVVFWNKLLHYPSRIPAVAYLTPDDEVRSAKFSGESNPAPHSIAADLVTMQPTKEYMGILLTIDRPLVAALGYIAMPEGVFMPLPTDYLGVTDTAARSAGTMAAQAFGHLPAYDTRGLLRSV